MFTDDTKSAVEVYVRKLLSQYIPAPVHLRWHDLPLSDSCYLSVSWSSFKTGWMSRPIQFPVQFNTIVDRQLKNYGWLGKLVAWAVRPFFRNSQLSYPVTVMGKADVSYPAGTKTIMYTNTKRLTTQAVLDITYQELEPTIEYFRAIQLSQFKGI